MTSSLLRVVVDDFDVPHLLYLLALPLRAGTSLSSQESCTRRLFLCQHASTRARSRGSLARPYMLLLISLSRFTCPSRGPWLQGNVNPASTAALSWWMPRAIDFNS